MIIENKHCSGNVWFDQLNPSRTNLGEGTIVYKDAPVLEWKEIIKQLNHLLEVETISGYETIMIEDFLSYIDGEWAFLNPYDKLHQCKGNNELLNRRIYNLLKEITLDESKVALHRGWGYYIKTQYEQIRQIGLILTSNDDILQLEVSLYFGDTQRQAIAFYTSNPNLANLTDDKWKYFPNFHVSFMTTGLVWFKRDNNYWSEEDCVRYLNYWGDNVANIFQQKRNDVADYLDGLVEHEIIVILPETKEQLDEKFYSTAMTTLNVCPGFGFLRTFTLSEAEELDRTGKLKVVIAAKIRECLGIVGIDGNDILNQFQ